MLLQPQAQPSTCCHDLERVGVGVTRGMAAATATTLRFSLTLLLCLLHPGLGDADARKEDALEIGIEAFDARRYGDAMMHLTRSLRDDAAAFEETADAAAADDAAAAADTEAYVERRVLASDYLSWAFHELGRHQEALDHAFVVLQFEPDNARVRENIRKWVLEDGTRLAENPHFAKARAALTAKEWALATYHLFAVLSDTSDTNFPRTAAELAVVHEQLSRAFTGLRLTSRAVRHGEIALSLDGHNERMLRTLDNLRHSKQATTEVVAEGTGAAAGAGAGAEAGEGGGEYGSHDEL